MVHQIYEIHWRGIDIEVGYEVANCCSGLSHRELRSINPPRARLPMTETGYRSHFHQAGLIENYYDGDGSMQKPSQRSGWTISKVQNSLRYFDLHEPANFSFKALYSSLCLSGLVVLRRCKF